MQADTQWFLPWPATEFWRNDKIISFLFRKNKIKRIK